EQTTCDGVRVSVVRVETHEELVTAVAADAVVVAQAGAEVRAQLLQQAVTAEVTDRIVDVLEVVDVDQQERVARLQPRDQRVGVAAAPDAGQRVTQRLLAERLEQTQLLQATAELARQQLRELIGHRLTLDPERDHDGDHTRRPDKRYRETVARSLRLTRNRGAGRE